MCQVFTWYGATIETDGTTELVYTADEVCACALLVLFYFGILIVIWLMLFSFQIKLILVKFFYLFLISNIDKIS